MRKYVWTTTAVIALGMAGAFLAAQRALQEPESTFGRCVRAMAGWPLAFCSADNPKTAPRACCAAAQSTPPNAGSKPLSLIVFQTTSNVFCRTAGLPCFWPWATTAPAARAIPRTTVTTGRGNYLPFFFRLPAMMPHASRRWICSASSRI